MTPTKSGRLSLRTEAGSPSIPTSAICSTLVNKKYALREVRRNIIQINDEIQTAIEEIPTSDPNTRITARRSRRLRNLDTTHITCALTPRRTSEKKLKVYTPENCKLDSKNQNVRKTRSTGKFEEEKGPKVITEKNHCTAIRKSNRNNNDADATKQSKHPAAEKTFTGIKKVKNSSAKSIEDSIEICNGERVPGLYAVSQPFDQCDRAEKVESGSELHGSIIMPPIDENELSDKEEILESENELNESIKLKRRSVKLKRLHRNFLTTAKRKQSVIVYKATQKDLSNASESTPTASTLNKCLTPTTSATRLNDTFNSPQETPLDDDLTAHSFYDKSFTFNSPSLFSDASQHSPMILSKHNHSSSPLSEAANNTSISATPVILTPLNLAPTYDEVLESCKKFDIPEYEFQQPFYNNPDDVTQKKEVGFTVLSISCNKLNDCSGFQSVLGADLKGLNDWRKKQLQSIGGPAMLNRFRSTQQIREYLSTQKSVYITPHVGAPSRHDAKLWLKAREMVGNKTELDMKKSSEYYAEDSPIKIQRKKVTMMLNDDGGTSSGDEDRNCSGRSLTMTPMTPASAQSRKADEQGDIGELEGCQGDILTPLTTHIKHNGSYAKQRRSHSKRSRLSLTSKFKKAAAAATAETNDDNSTSLSEAPKIKCITTEHLLKSDICATNPSQEKPKDSQSSDPSSITSQEVLIDLGRTSFINNLNLTSSGQHDVSFGLTNATLNNTFGFKVNLENLQQAKANIEFNYLTTITLEVFVPTRGDYFPDPFRDEIRCIFYAIENSIPTQETAENIKKKLPRNSCGYIIVNDVKDIIEKEGRRHGIDADINVQVVHSELEAMHALLELCSLWDPDIYAGYEIEMSSWGYIIERAKHLNFNICSLLSRVPAQKVRDFVDEDRDQFTDLDIEMKLCGRILLDVWRLMRSEIALTSYTFENVMYHIMHRRCPCHSYADLTAWFASPVSRWITIEYYLERVRGTLALLDQLDLIGRTCEMAKLIGIQFYEVLSRGSQFRVESMMLRIAKPRNLVPLSPSVQQRAHMRAPEYLALIMEPLSRFYVDPVIVLDFQSLYPSMIIAYNYCFSTCLGRVEHLGQTAPFEFGASQLKVSPSMLRHLLDEDLVTISPCGVVFVKSSVREGILPRMLTEILDTRQMVKQSMKLHKTNTALQRILHSRQLGLKLMANVTYGYTAANFSGRMPSVEVGDTVVSKGRETLERAIKMVEANDRWNVNVVYGDTDSMFIQVPGRSRAKAFEIGAEIAEAVTKANPHPVKLKLEKVYQPCILQTKKRYVGYMYETPDQTEPVYEAKGIETVRRDGCPAAVKMLEKVLRILFETKDVSKVKQYVCRQFTKLLSGRANLQDLIFSKEFRGLTGYKPTACVPALELTRKWIQIDPRHIPRRGERVPFIITNGPPGVPLIRLVRSPHEVLADDGLKINAIYYITKAIIPPLNRCLLLIGADVNDWFASLPRKILTTPALSNANEVISTTLNALQVKKSTISQYFSTTNCIIDCGRHTKNGICSACDKNATKSITILHSKISKIERGFYSTQQICQACCGRIGDINCISLDCPVLFVLGVKRKDLQQIVHFRNLLEERF